MNIERIVPGELLLNLEPRISRVIKVAPVFDETKLHDDYQIKNVIVSPIEVHIIGPASEVNALTEVKTEEIPLDNSITDNSLTVSMIV